MNKSLISIVGVFILICLLNACSTNKNSNDFKILKLSSVVIDGLEYIDISSFNIHRNGSEDDSQIIQNVFDNYENIYFSKGDYYIASDRICPYRYSSIFITERSAVRRIVFEEGARLIVPKSFRSLTKKSCILHFHAEKGNIDNIYINGLKIIAEDRDDSKEISGLFVSETYGNLVQSFTLENAHFENLSYTSITTHATNSKILNTTTINSGFHGLAAINPYNPTVKHEIWVKDFTSVNDSRNSIDLSGKKSFEKKSVASNATLENIHSEGSGFGIKIASNWDLKFSDSKILNSGANGFYVNYAYPGNKVELKNIEISGSKKIGLSLDHNVVFDGENIFINDCHAGAFLKNSRANIRNLTIKGNEHSKFGLSMFDNGSISGLNVSGVRAEYPVRIVGTGNTLSEVAIMQNNDKHSILVEEKASNTKISNIQTDKDIRIIQKEGKVQICNYSGNLVNRFKVKVDCNQ